uniref:Uncharacterized protein n=1 Tax=Panagrolaimus sp. PS1159 TaxID=55785 RepID=A0AC35FC93_9BILA
MDSESKVGRKYVVDTSQRRPPSWQKAQSQPTERLVSQYTHDRQNYHEHNESEQPPMKEHQKHVEKITTVHSSTTTMKGHPNLRVQLTNNDHVHQAVTEAAENKFINARIPHSPMITPPSTPISLEPETDVPAPKIARGIFKNLERSVAEELRREQENNSSSSIFKREQDALEAKKRLAEESLQHPGRKPKGGQILFGGSDAYSYGSQTSEEI